MAIELSHRCFIEHSQYYTGCAWPTVLGVGETPYEALADAIACAKDVAGEDAEAYDEELVDALAAYPLDEPDEVGELGEIPGAFDDGSEVSWHCELTIGGME
jgi:protein involved in temperature-dependent protein secretion